MRPPLFLAVALALAAASFAVPAILSASRGDSSAPRAELHLPGVANPPADVAGPTERLGPDERIAFWAARIKQQPSDFLSLIQLGTTYAEKARLTADLDGYQRATAAIAKALELSPSYPPAIRARGAIYFALHNFAAAEADARTVLARAPADPDALATLGDALVEEGRLDEAAAAYDRLATLAAGPALDVRMARLAYVRGQAADALVDAQRALNTSASEDAVSRGFYAFAVGEYARLSGHPDVARDAYGRALALRPTDLGSLVGLARVDAAAGRVDDAMAGLRKAAAIAPQPETLALLGDLLAARGETAAAKRQYDTVRVIRHLSELAGTVYDRPLLLFELDHGGVSTSILDAARRSAADRPDATGHDLVAWAAYRLGRVDEARAQIRAALATGIRDARILYHAGTIEIAGGDAARGRTLLREALALGPALGPLDTAEAQRLLGQ